MLTPFPKSWWVHPPWLLAGCYPGDQDPLERDLKLKALLAAGIRQIICLQEPRELAGFAPYEPALKSLCDETGLSVICLNFPIRDYSVPSVEQMNVALDAIDRAIAARIPVYVHCWGGHGRTGTVIGCWLVRRGYAGAEAIQRIGDLRRGDPQLASQDAPQGQEQWLFVMEWATWDRVILSGESRPGLHEQTRCLASINSQRVA